LWNFCWRYTETEADNLKQSYEELAVLLEAGQLNLESENKVKLEVPPQCVKSCNEAKYMEEEDVTLLILGSILLAIILFVLVCFVCGVCMKKKQQDEKLRHLTSSGKEFVPSYRNMAFTENMEGTMDSLQKYKRGPTQTTTSPMMPNYQAMRMQSNSSIMLQDAERGMVLDGRGAPAVPAKYSQPTEQELENTKTLPEHKMSEILDKVNRDSLPGTPQDH